MGAGIAQVAAKAGHQVLVYDLAQGALDKGRAGVDASLKGLVKRGTLDEDGAGEVLGRIRWTIELADLAAADLVIEAIIEDPTIKGDLFARLEELVGDEAVIATNTSSLSVTRLAAGLRRPKRFLGMHFFNPAPVMKLVEVVRGSATDPAVESGIVDLAIAWGKVAVRVRDVPGFIVNRVARPFYGEGWRALEQGAADAATIDHAFRACAGFRMGPLELGDLEGRREGRGRLGADGAVDRDGVGCLARLHLRRAEVGSGRGCRGRRLRLGGGGGAAGENEGRHRGKGQESERTSAHRRPLRKGSGDSIFP